MYGTHCNINYKYTHTHTHPYKSSFWIIGTVDTAAMSDYNGTIDD